MKATHGTYGGGDTPLSPASPSSHTPVGQIEKETQRRVVDLFRDGLKYRYLGNWIDRAGNRNVDEKLLRAWLQKRGIDEALIGRVLHILSKAAGDTTKSLYDRNHAVYDLLRYGVKVRPDVGANMETVWLIDWKHPDRNDFAIAEEVTVTPADDKAHVKRPDLVIWVTRGGGIDDGMFVAQATISTLNTY